MSAQIVAALRLRAAMLETKAEPLRLQERDPGGLADRMLELLEWHIQEYRALADVAEGLE